MAAGEEGGRRIVGSYELTVAGEMAETDAKSEAGGVEGVDNIVVGEQSGSVLTTNSSL